MAYADTSMLPRHMSALQLLRRSLADNRANLPLYAALVFLGLWAVAVVTWGLPALYLPAVVASPLMVLLLVAISRG